MKREQYIDYVLADDRRAALEAEGFDNVSGLWQLFKLVPKYIRHDDGGGRVSGQGLNIRFFPAVDENTGGLTADRPGIWRAGYGRNLKDMRQGANLANVLADIILLQAQKRKVRQSRVSYYGSQLERMTEIVNDKSQTQENRDRAFRSMVFYEDKLAEAAGKVQVVDAINMEV